MMADISLWVKSASVPFIFFDRVPRVIPRAFDRVSPVSLCLSISTFSSCVFIFNLLSSVVSCSDTKTISQHFVSSQDTSYYFFKKVSDNSFFLLDLC